MGLDRKIQLALKIAATLAIIALILLLLFQLSNQPNPTEFCRLEGFEAGQEVEKNIFICWSDNGNQIEFFILEE